MAFKKLGVLLAASAVVGCGKGNPASQHTVAAVMKGSFKTVRSHKALRDLPGPDAVTLLDVTGEADSLLLLTPEDGCGFGAWTANDQDGPIGQEGRTGEAFDLAHPASWSSMGTGLRDGCTGGKLNSAEAYFYYLDFHLDLDGNATEDRVVRIFTSESGGAKFGDIQVKDADGIFKWVDTAASDALVAVRPSSPATYAMSNSSGPLQVPWYDRNGTVKMVMTKLPFQLTASSTSREVTRDIRKVVFNVDFTSAGLTVSNKASAASVARSLSIPFLTNVNAQLTVLKAEVTPLVASQVDGPDDPAPGIGGGSVPARDAGTADAGS